MTEYISNFNWQDTIYSDGSKNFIKYSKNKLSIKLQVYKENDIEAIFLRTNPDGEQILKRMKKTSCHTFFDYYTAQIDIKKNINNYRFLIITSKDMYWYSQRGLTRINPPDSVDFKFIRDLKLPSWLASSVFYQIFPDRFCDGNGETNVKNGEYKYEGHSTRALKWGEEPPSYKKGSHLDFFGGDLAGIKKNIPYLKKLGINALYLNPIFLSPSNHKYDTQDYKTIDPHFGTNEEFASLVTELHSNGIKIILDGVFNHIGISHFWFNGAGFYPENTGAYNDKNSLYREYFTFYKDRDYHCWNGVKTLPKLNYKSEKLREEIYSSKNSIMNFWMSPPYNIDGWRLDVANMLARQDDYQQYKEIYREMRKWTKSTKEDSFLMGEHFFDPTDILQGDMLDSVMNYQGFLFPVIKWLTKKERFKLDGNKNFRDINYNVSDFKENLSAYSSLIPFDIQSAMFNLLDCHDLPRFFSLVEENFYLHKMAATLLFTYPGVPCIYYGDEIAMKGLMEQEARRCMVWYENSRDQNIFNMFRELIKLRKNNEALKYGSFKILYGEDEIFAYMRFYKDTGVLVILNNNDKEKKCFVPLWHTGETEGFYREYFTGNMYEVKEGYMELTIPPYGSFLLCS